MLFRFFKVNFNIIVMPSFIVVTFGGNFKNINNMEEEETIQNIKGKIPVVFLMEVDLFKNIIMVVA